MLPSGLTKKKTDENQHERVEQKYMKTQYNAEDNGNLSDSLDS